MAAAVGIVSAVILITASHWLCLSRTCFLANGKQKAIELEWYSADNDVSCGTQTAVVILSSACVLLSRLL